MRRNVGRNYRPNPPKQRFKLFPVMYCVHENLVIAFSKMYLRLKGDRWGNLKPKEKVHFTHWQEHTCIFRDPKYRIDLVEYQKGDVVLCPYCEGVVDFRLFPSSTLPTMVDVIKKEEGSDPLANEIDPDAPPPKPVKSD